MIAHEYGHHVQDQLGRPQQAPGRRAGRREQVGPFGAPGRLLRRRLGRHAVDTGLIEQLTQADVSSGLAAAAAIGDDRIQERDAGPGPSRDLDAWLVRAAAPLVFARLRQRQARRLRHLLRLDLTRRSSSRSSTARAGPAFTRARKPRPLLSRLAAACTPRLDRNDQRPPPPRWRKIPKADSGE